MIAAARSREDLDAIADDVAADGRVILQWLIRDGESIAAVFYPNVAIELRPEHNEELLDARRLNYAGATFARAAFVPNGEAWPVCADRIRRA